MSTTRTLRALLLLVIVTWGATELVTGSPGPRRSRHEREGLGRTTPDARQRLRRRASHGAPQLSSEWELSAISFSKTEELTAESCLLALPLQPRIRRGLIMELTSGLLIGIGLFLVVLVPYLMFEIRRGKARGHTWFTWRKPRGHSDIGPDVGFRQTRPGVDEARGARK